jgi:hypothetical protein
MQTITSINVSITKSIKSYKRVEIQQYIQYDGLIIGLVANGLTFYFNGMKAGDITNNGTIANNGTNNNHNGPVKVVTRSVDYCAVNQAISHRDPPTIDGTKNLGTSLYTNYLYQLFVAEFINYLNSERNIAIREKITELITRTNFKKDVDNFRKEIRTMLNNYPGDRSIINQMLENFRQTCFDKTIFLDQISNQVYDFDRITMRRLKTLPKDKMKAELKLAAEKFTTSGEINADITFPNIFMPCEVSKQEYCKNRRLIINRPMDDLIDILAADLSNDLKSKYLLEGAFADIVIDYFTFEKFSFEMITIYKITE